MAHDHQVLKTDPRRRAGCKCTLWLLDRIIDGSNPQEPVELHFPSDDLFAPMARRRGLPIGNLTSQFFANCYLNPLDHFALFSDSEQELEVWRARVATFLEGRRLKLHPRKTFVVPTSVPAEFLGFVLLPGGRRRLPEGNVVRFRNRLRGMGDRLRAGSMTNDDAVPRVRAWAAHAAHADTYRLRRAIFNQMHQPTGSAFDWGLTDPVSPRHSRRLLEQQSEERPLCEPQQEQRNEPEQQQRFPRGEHASMPELRRSRPSKASRGCVQGLS